MYTAEQTVPSPAVNTAQDDETNTQQAATTVTKLYEEIGQLRSSVVKAQILSLSVSSVQTVDQAYTFLTFLTRSAANIMLVTDFDWNEKFSTYDMDNIKQYVEDTLDRVYYVCGRHAIFPAKRKYSQALEFDTEIFDNKNVHMTIFIISDVEAKWS